ncbi:MAG: helix-turn-helix transcriptional regulator [Pseudomonadota bacterium]
MRQVKALQVLRLALLMRGATLGVSLADIARTFEVTERTAHRLRNAVAELFPDIESGIGADQRRYWRLPKGTVDRLIHLDAEEVAALESSRRLLATQGYDDLATRLQHLGEKVQALLQPAVGRRLAPDVEALLEAEGVALRPGPRPERSPAVVERLREAIKSCRAVRLLYHYRRGRGTAEVEVEPYGILLGSRHYLVAHRPEATHGPFLRMYALPEIERAEVLERSFVRDPEVSLQAFAERAFGIFQEPPRRIVWRFAASVAHDARQFVFHPSQEQHLLPDGRLEVRFEAGGLLEMCWHLFTWGERVEVVEPLALRDLYRRCLDEGGAPPPTLSEDDRQADLFDHPDLSTAA